MFYFVLLPLTSFLSLLTPQPTAHIFLLFSGKLGDTKLLPIKPAALNVWEVPKAMPTQADATPKTLTLIQGSLLCPPPDLVSVNIPL